MLTVKLPASSGVVHATLPANLTPVPDCHCRHCSTRRRQLARAALIEREWHDLEQLQRELAEGDMAGELCGRG